MLIFVNMKRFFITLIALALGLQLSAVEYGVVNISVCNMRRTSTYSAEMVSQALLGTPVHILSVEKGWPQIQTPDGYKGFVNRDAVFRMTKDQYHKWNEAPKVQVTALFSLVVSHPDEAGETISDVVAGDRLWYLGRHNGYLNVRFPDGREGYIKDTDAAIDEEWKATLRQDPEAVLNTAMSMIGFPYLWGGTSPKGFDCSGFVRTVLAMHGIIIPRDACDQVPATEKVSTDRGIDLLQPGDLVFFGNKDTGRVRHVGFYLGEGKFIHCIGKVHINSFIPTDPDYDKGNSPTLLYGGRLLPYIDKNPLANTYWTNPYYLE